MEGFSTFIVNSNGTISSHKVDKVCLSLPLYRLLYYVCVCVCAFVMQVMPGGKEKNRVMSWLAQVGVALRSAPQPSVDARTHEILLHNT